MKISKLFKKILMISPLSLPLATLSFTPNTVSKTDETTEQENALKLEWNNFIKQDSIWNLLNIAYKDESQKQAYIDSQFELLSNPDYKQQIKNAFVFGNNMTQSFIQGEFDWGTFSRIKPFLVEQSTAQIDQLLSTNWLYALFTITQFDLIKSTLLDNENLDTTSNDPEKIYSNYAKISSNQFIDYVYAKNSDETLDDLYYLLSKNGFILEIGIEKDWQNPELLKPKLHGYVKTFPNIINNDYILDIFDLNKYVQLFAPFGVDNSNKANTNEILFIDNYGGVKLTYTFVDVN
ncbi:aromatic motif membrane protein [Mycoplasma sp. 1199]|uniref:aromatic motif membrane protein n=1 Tax=Mycoplasma sp. 1199 TaxID=3108526 RepID=UPI002B1D66C6|nr:aromatic motif membrane protein [Mycoplasma sp. 1199]MEA4206088.1 aromatic motif membrane protein [Mycoplasma sp. 1199]